MGLQPRAVGQGDHARRDVIDGGEIVGRRRGRRAGEARCPGGAIHRGERRALGAGRVLVVGRRVGGGRRPFRFEQLLENVAVVGRRDRARDGDAARRRTAFGWRGRRQRRELGGARGRQRGGLV